MMSLAQGVTTRGEEGLGGDKGWERKSSSEDESLSFPGADIEVDSPCGESEGTR